jgi:Icc protein
VRELLGTLGKPVWCLPGNHDDIGAMRRELGAAPFSVGGHHDLGAWRIVMLDSCVAGQAHGRISAAELARLDAALASAAERHVLVSLHHHPVRMASRWLDSVALQNADDFFAVTDRYPQLRAISVGPRAPVVRFTPQGRAVAGGAVDLRPVPAALRPVRRRPEPAWLPAPHAAR